MVVSPEPADVLATIITPIRRPDGSVGTIASYDPHERVWNPSMPLLFQRWFSVEQRGIPGHTRTERRSLTQARRWRGQGWFRVRRRAPHGLIG